MKIVNHIINLELMDPMSIYISDMDGNGQINILDVILVINIILGLDNFNNSADINIDENIDVLDVVLLVNIILN